VTCVLPSDLNTGIEHRRVEPRAGCSKLQFLSEQGGGFDNSACVPACIARYRQL